MHSRHSLEHQVEKLPTIKGKFFSGVGDIFCDWLICSHSQRGIDRVSEVSLLETTLQVA